MIDTPATWTFRDIDREFGLAKGNAFIAFKRVRDQLAEGQDFLYFNGQEYPDTIEALKRDQRLYASSVHAVVLYEPAYRLVADYLRRKPA